MNMKSFAEGMDGLLDKVKSEGSLSSITLKYAKELMKFTSTNESERIIFSTLSEHLIYWIERCQRLEKQKEDFNYRAMENQDDQTESTASLPRSASESEESEEPSMCSYIVDPKEQIKMKPMREDLKKQLHLNFSKVDFLRKKEI
jgi:hypothetical protein